MTRARCGRRREEVEMPRSHSTVLSPVLILPSFIAHLGEIKKKKDDKNLFFFSLESWFRLTT